MGIRWKMRPLAVLPPSHCGETQTGFGAYGPRDNLKSHDGSTPSSTPIPPQGRLPPCSHPGARFWRDLGRRPVLVWTAHSAAKTAAPCVSRRRQGANAVPGASRGPGAAARRSGGVRRGKTLPSATSNPTLGRASRLGAPRPGDGMRPSLPGVGAQCARGQSGFLGLPPAHPAPLAAWAQPRGRPHLEAGGRVGRIPGATSRGRWNVRRGEERRSLHPRSLLAPRPRPGGPISARCEGRTPRPPLAALRLPGRGAHLLARASACSPRARAASCDIGHPGTVASQHGNDQL